MDEQGRPPGSAGRIGGLTFLPPSDGPAPGVTYATPGARLVAYIIDSLILSALTILPSVVFFVWVGIATLAGDVAGVEAGTVVFIVGFLALAAAYLGFFWVRGATPGMRAVHIKVVRRDGRALGIGTALARLLGYWLSGLAFYIGFAWLLFDRDRQGWHDKLADTIVIEA